MTDGLPCPNPACAHVFRHVDVQGAAALTCPRCGSVFQFRAGGHPPPPLWVGVPVTRNAEAPANGDVLPPTMIQGGLRRHARDRLSVLMPLAVAGVAVALIIGGYFTFRSGQTQRQKPGEEESAGGWVIHGKVLSLGKRQEPAFRLVFPPDVWTADSTKKALGPVVAVRRSNPDVWLAVATQDYGPHQPRDAQLLQEAVGRLEKYFGDNLELAAKPDTREVAGKPAHVLEFKGLANEVVWHGECYALTERGIGYWLFVAAPRVDTARQVLTALQQSGRGFALAAQRDGWTELPLPTETFQGARCALKAAESIWTKFRATDEDERGDLFLIGRDRKETDPTVKNLKNATVLVMVFDKAQVSPKGALPLVQDYLTMRKHEEDKDSQLVPASDEVRPQTEAVGDRRGSVVDLKLVTGQEARKYLLLAVVAEADTVYAIRCQCNWQHRQIWQSDFRALLRSFRLRRADKAAE